MFYAFIAYIWNLLIELEIKNYSLFILIIMTGGLLQLVAKGPDDMYLINNPEITLFKMVYRRHSNFAMFPLYLNFAKKMNFGSVGRCKIRKNGDLVNNLYLIVKLPDIKMAYPLLTKKELQTLLATYGIIWTVPILELNDTVTASDYNEILILANAHIQELIIEKNIQTNRKIIINTEYLDTSTSNGRDYANAVFPLLIQGDVYDPLYDYLASYKKDNTTVSVQNSDDDLIAFYNDLITKLIIEDSVFPLLSPNIIFYQVIEFGSYAFTQSILNYNMKYIFDKSLESGYAINGVDTTLDSYKVYNKYFDQLTNIRSNIQSQNDINTTLLELMADIVGNFRQNILQLINIITILQKNNFDLVDQFRISVFKSFKFISTSVYNGTNPMNVLLNASDVKLVDNFSTIILKNVSTTSFHNYFGTFISSAIQTFYSSIRESYRTSVLQEYFGDVNIWNRLKMSIFGSTTYAVLDSVYIMNLIPYYVVDDIAAKVTKYLGLNNDLNSYVNDFDLVGSVFVLSLKSAIDDMYIAYNTTTSGNDIYGYLTEINNVYRFGSDVLLVSMLKSEIILSIDTSVYSQEVLDKVDVLENTYNGSSYLNKTDLLPIEYVIHSFILKYVQLIYDFTTDDVLRSTLVSFIVSQIVNNFRTKVISPTDSTLSVFPTYTTFKNNNYSFFQINNAIIQTTSATQPEFLDAASSIWYYVNRQMVNSFNGLFIDTLLSPSVYTNSLGSNIKSALDEFTTLLTANGYAPDANYTNIDFYKLRLNGPSSATYATLVSSYTSMYNTFNTMFSKYQSDKKMFKIKNLSLNKSRNYYRKFADVFGIIRAEILNNPATYYPLDLNITPDPAIIISEIEADLLNSGYQGVVDIKYIVRTDLNNAITSAINNINPYISGTYLYQWFITYNSYINSTLLEQYDDVVTYINDANSLNQYIDPNVSTIYGKLNTTTFVLSYMMDLVISKSGLNVYINAISNTNKNLTYINFLAIVNKAITNIDLIMANISNVDVSGVPTNEFTGSIVSDNILKYIIKNIPPFAWVKEIGHRIIETIHIEIGGQVIEQHTDNWLREHHNIFSDYGKERGYNNMIGNIPELYSFKVQTTNVTGNSKDGYTLYIPLVFWFNKYFAQSLPLIAMKYTDIELVVKFRDLADLAIWDKTAVFVKQPAIVDCKLLANYVYVETDERERLANNKHEYLMEIVEHNGEIIFGKNNLNINANNMSMTVQAFFNNPCKFLAGYLKFIPIRSQTEINNTSVTPDFLINAYNGFSTDVPMLSNFGLNINDSDKYDWLNDVVSINGVAINPIIDMRIKFNGHDRENQKEFSFYKYVHPNNYNKTSLPNNMFVYNFCLDPTVFQPSGSVNMSKINEFLIIFNLNPLVYNEIIAGRMNVRVGLYNYSYNILRVMSGMAACAFFG